MNWPDDYIVTDPYYYDDDFILYCGDCRDIGPSLPVGCSSLIVADPPYGMGKERNGVANDNLRRGKLDAFQMEWWRAFRGSLTDNASAYIFGNPADLWRLWYGYLSDNERMTFRNEIVWDKSGQEDNPTLMVNGVAFKNRRMYQPTERILFFMLGEQGFNNNADNYWEGWEPIRKYLKDEFTKLYDMGYTRKDIDVGMFGCTPTSGGMVSHYIGTSQWAFITEKNYKILQTHANGLAFTRSYDDLKAEYDDLKAEYDDLKAEWYATRAYFDNTHENMTDVWQYPRVKGADRHGHPTPKPVAMMERIIKSSSREGDIIIDPFCGVGPIAVAAKNTGRKVIAFELKEKWCENTVKRIGKNITPINTMPIQQPQAVQVEML